MSLCLAYEKCNYGKIFTFGSNQCLSTICTHPSVRALGMYYTIVPVVSGLVITLTKLYNQVNVENGDKEPKSPANDRENPVVGVIEPLSEHSRF